jgi:hypothetical protein
MVGHGEIVHSHIASGGEGVFDFEGTVQ